MNLESRDIAQGCLNLSLGDFPRGTYNLNFRAGTDPELHSARLAVK